MGKKINDFIGFSIIILLVLFILFEFNNYINQNLYLENRILAANEASDISHRGSYGSSYDRFLTKKIKAAVSIKKSSSLGLITAEVGVDGYRSKTIELEPPINPNSKRLLGESYIIETFKNNEIDNVVIVKDKDGDVYKQPSITSHNIIKISYGNIIRTDNTINYITDYTDTENNYTKNIDENIDENTTLTFVVEASPSFKYKLLTSSGVPATYDISTKKIPDSGEIILLFY